MSKHDECLRDAAKEAQRMVFDAASPVKPGEGIKAQMRNASQRLELDFGVVWRAWNLRSGPKIVPTIRKAWLVLVSRRGDSMGGDGIAEKLAELGERIAQLANIVETANRQSADDHSVDARRARFSRSSV